MIILDFLFKICFAPLSEYGEKGKQSAVFCLAPPLSFFLMSLLNVVLYWIKPLIEINLTPLYGTIAICVLILLVMHLLQSIYIRDNRQLGKNYHPLTGLLIPVLIIGSLILFVMSLRYS